MKITCQACSAKYTIADEKVLGKIVKIRCKKCGATLVVNGSASGDSAGGDWPDALRAFDAAGQGAAQETWTVSVADGDQRAMTEAEITAAYRAGVVQDESFCWKDGMVDWLPLREIEPLYAACAATRAAGVSLAPDQVATAMPSPMPSLFAGQGAASHPPASAGGRVGGGDGLAVQVAAVPSAAPGPTLAPAARRVGGRAPGADLFSGAAQAGGEDDVMTSAPRGIPQAHEDANKPTGARNESSVLFSLNALTSKAGPGGTLPASSTTEGSGLIDIRQLSAQLKTDHEQKPTSSIDDIMNLAGGGAFSPAMNAPVLSAPPIEEYAAPHPAQATPSTTPAKNKVVILGALGLGAFLVVGAIGAALMTTHKGPETVQADQGAAATSAAPATMASASAPPAATQAPAPPAASESATPPAATDTAAPQAAAEAKPPAKEQPAAPKEPRRPAAPREGTGAQADQPFNMGAAKASLGSIAEGVQSCKRGGAGGTGRVVVTFSPSGRVQSAALSGPPFEGTSSGACVLSRFRGARVPAFSGSPFSVSKHFTIN